MKKKSGSILVFILVCVGVLGTMLMTFLGTTTPMRVFYNSAVPPYGFLDDSQNLHGLLELESESVKNLALRHIKNEKRLMFQRIPVIWNEDKLNDLKNLLNKTSEGYWQRAGENFIQKICGIAHSAASKKIYDQTREMYENVSDIIHLSMWSYYKMQEERIIKIISSPSFDDSKDLIGEKVLELLEELKHLNLMKDEGLKSGEIKEIQKMLNDVLGSQHPQWQEDIKFLKPGVQYKKEYMNALTEMLKPLPEERLRELIFLRKIERNLDGKTSIDANTWQEINELLSIEESLPQVDQAKKNFLNFLKEQERKFFLPNGQTQPQTSEEVRLIRTGISGMFQISIENAIEQRDSHFGDNEHLRERLLTCIDAIIPYQFRLYTDTLINSYLQDILKNKNLINKLRNSVMHYNLRMGNENYQKLKELAKNHFNEALSLEDDKDTKRLQSIFVARNTPDRNYFEIDTFAYKKNFNMESTVKVCLLDGKLPLTVKFKEEVKEVVRLIFQDQGIDEKEITLFLDDLEKLIDVLNKPDSIQASSILKKEELEYFRKIIEDFRDTKYELNVNIFQEFSSWKAIFQGKNLCAEGGILHYLGENLTFARVIDSINFYAAETFTRQALVYTLPLRPEISNQEKKAASLPISQDPTQNRQEIQKIFNYGLQVGNNYEVKLKNNKETIRKILQLLHEAKLVNFSENQDGKINVLHSYSKAVQIVASVWDKDNRFPLNRTTNYHCRVEYAGNGKSEESNTVQTIEEL
ncbi:MAG: hypothetical protein LBC11_00340 [Puniceicoccales bacterium]|jgi:hypothetical protein|nr:hypothetical protein [Puniceicoccales bacterium]